MLIGRSPGKRTTAAATCRTATWAKMEHHSREGRSSGMEEFVQTSRNSGRTQTDQQTPPESLPISGDSRLIADVKREHEGCAAVAPCKSQRTSCNAIDPTIALNDTQRKVLEELVMSVDANASIVISDPRAKGAARPSSGWRLVCRSPTAPLAPAPAPAPAPPPAPK